MRPSCLLMAEMSGCGKRERKGKETVGPGCSIQCTGYRQVSGGEMGGELTGEDGRRCTVVFLTFQSIALNYALPSGPESILVQY